MRILHVSHYLPPHGDDGIPEYTVAVARAQTERGHEVTVFARGAAVSDTPGGTETETAPFSEGLRVIESHARAADLLPHQRYRWDMADRFRRLVGEWRPDVVHFQHLRGHSLDYPEIARAAGATTVLTVHDPWFTCPTVRRVEWQGKPCRSGPGRACLACVWDGPRRSSVVPRETIYRIANLPGLGKLLDLSPTADELTGWAESSRECLHTVDLVISASESLAEDLRAHGIDPPRMVVAAEYALERLDAHLAELDALYERARGDAGR
jgi:glycosyltransferase involved in cell wall biosynthesis